MKDLKTKQELIDNIRSMDSNNHIHISMTTEDDETIITESFIGDGFNDDAGVVTILPNKPIGSNHGGFMELKDFTYKSLLKLYNTLSSRVEKILNTATEECIFNNVLSDINNVKCYYIQKLNDILNNYNYICTTSDVFFKYHDNKVRIDDIYNDEGNNIIIEFTLDDSIYKIDIRVLDLVQINIITKSFISEIDKILK